MGVGTLIPERVMVCMSSNALAPRVIRTGARMAGRLGAKWYAVYVETPQEQPDRMPPGDVASQREGITHVIIGESDRSRWERLWRGSTIGRFLASVRDAAVHVVPLDRLA
jgi:two-component system, OmpR family, sensor histidine kinase KdpD